MGSEGEDSWSRGWEGHKRELGLGGTAGEPEGGHQPGPGPRLGRRGSKKACLKGGGDQGDYYLGLEIPGFRSVGEEKTITPGHRQQLRGRRLPEIRNGDNTKKPGAAGGARRNGLKN